MITKTQEYIRKVNNKIMKPQKCPKCQSKDLVKHGIIKGRQRYQCRICLYHFTVWHKLGKNIENQYIISALQLFLEGVELRSIEKFLGVSRESVTNWVKKYGPGLTELKNQTKRKKIVTVEKIFTYTEAKKISYKSGLLFTGIENKCCVIR